MRVHTPRSAVMTIIDIIRPLVEKLATNSQTMRAKIAIKTGVIATRNHILSV